MATAKQTIKEAPVGKYKERPLADALADPKDVAKIEDRQPDQNETYHKDHPTLKPLKVAVEKPADPQ